MMIRFIYSLLFYLALPFILLRLLWRSRHNSAYRQRIAERFAYYQHSLPGQGIWIHAVSFGEMQVAKRLIDELTQQHPQLAIILTTMTITGFKYAQQINSPQVHTVYVPYDIPNAIKRFLHATKPQLAIMIETELWPNTLHACKQRNIPVMLINARLSEKSAKGYQRISYLTKPMLRCIHTIAAQHQNDAKRFIRLGYSPQKIQVTGSIKFDVHIDPALQDQAAELKTLLGKRPVWIAASTHQGEDKLVLTTHQQLLKTVPELLLILVPRHPERFNDVAKLCQTQGFDTTRRTQLDTYSQTTQVLLGDSMGELMLLYAISDIAFVGGSLINIGGHNPLEPAALGLPILSGSYYHNFQAIYDKLSAQRGVQIVNGVQNLTTQLKKWLINKEAAKQVGAAAKSFVFDNQGATKKVALLITSVLCK